MGKKIFSIIQLVNWIGHLFKHDISAQGVANPNYSGSLASLSQLASMLEQSETEPIILFESQDKYLKHLF